MSVRRSLAALDPSSVAIRSMAASMRSGMWMANPPSASTPKWTPPNWMCALTAGSPFARTTTPVTSRFAAGMWGRPDATTGSVVTRSSCTAFGCPGPDTISGATGASAGLSRDFLALSVTIGCGTVSSVRSVVRRGADIHHAHPIRIPNAATISRTRVRVERVAFMLGSPRDDVDLARDDANSASCDRDFRSGDENQFDRVLTHPETSCGVRIHLEQLGPRRVSFLLRHQLRPLAPGVQGREPTGWGAARSAVELALAPTLDFDHEATVQVEIVQRNRVPHDACPRHFQS